jgi:hypothetical protein
MLLRTLLVTAALTACATAQMDEKRGDQAQPDSGTTQADAPKQSGSPDAPAAGGCTSAVTGTLATWDFIAEPGNQASTPVKTVATGVVAGPVERAAVLTPVSGANAINSSNWPTTAQMDPTKHYKLTITPPSGCKLSITAVAIDAKASATGPTTAVVGTSADNYGGMATISTSVASAPSIAVTNQTATVELHVCGYGASSTSGTLRLQGTLSITGSLQ